MELIGTKPISGLLVSSSNEPKVRLLPYTSITRLPQYYEPVRHPTRLSLLLTEFSLRTTTSRRRGFPCFVPSPCACMPSPLPRRDRGGLVVQHSPRRRPSPHSSWVGSRIMPFRGRAPPGGWSSVHSGYGLPARGVAYATLFTEGFSACRYLLAPLRLLPAGTTVAGRDSHPLKMHDFSRRTRMAGMPNERAKRLLVTLLSILGLLIVGSAIWLAFQPLDIFVRR